MAKGPSPKESESQREQKPRKRRRTIGGAVAVTAVGLGIATRNIVFEVLFSFPVVVGGMTSIWKRDLGYLLNYLEDVGKNVETSYNRAARYLKQHCSRSREGSPRSMRKGSEELDMLNK
jgi:hypothetical protein